MILRRCSLVLALLAVAAAGSASAQAGHDHDHAHDHAAMHHPAADSAHDSAFTALQARGETAMGVNQYTSTHRFDDLPDGGRIELQRDPGDSAGVRTIRAHLRSIAEAFGRGDFSTPMFVHAREVPGTAVMAAKRDAIRYAYSPLPGGGEVRITSGDPEAVRAIHEFLAYQRGDHRAGGAAMPPDSAGNHDAHSHR